MLGVRVLLLKDGVTDWSTTVVPLLARYVLVGTSNTQGRSAPLDRQGRAKRVAAWGRVRGPRAEGSCAGVRREVACVRVGILRT